jgi:hypothetical protein
VLHKVGRKRKTKERKKIFPDKIVVATSAVSTAVTTKNAVFWDIKAQFELHRRHVTSPLQSPAS